MVKGRKVWGTETLSADEMQGYLQDQTVMVFTSASDRDAQVPAPRDGMCCYLEDVDLFSSRIGGTWKLWRGNDNAGQSGVVLGSVPPAGTPMLRKFVSGNLTSSAFGDNTVVYPGGAFPNGVLGCHGSTNPTTSGVHHQWVPWAVGTGQMNVRLVSGASAQANTTIMSFFEIVGW